MWTKASMAAMAVLVTLGMLALAGCGALGGDKYPGKQVTYLIPFDPGGQSDREARRQQPYLEKSLGQKVIIDYKAGGGGAIGWSELVRAKPDGYQVCGINIPHIILQPLQQDVGYKTDEIVPVAFFQATPLALAVPANSPYKTLKEFLDEAKKNPGKITIGGSGTFSGHHVAMLRLEKAAGTKFEYVPFTGAAPQMTAFLGGHVNAVIANSDDVVKYKDQSRVLGFATAERFAALPDAPTLKEQGLDIIEGIDRGVGVPPKTPENVIAVLEKAFLDLARNPEIVEVQKKEGFVPLAMGHKESKAHIEKLTAIYKELTAGLKK